MSKTIYLRNFIFGVEDSLVSTVGLLSGVAVAGVASRTILLTGVVLIFVEAFSMAVGSFLSEHSVDTYIKQAETASKTPVLGGIVMFLSYFISGFIPLAPYLFMDPQTAVKLSILLSLIALFILGTIGARLSNISLLKGGMRMAVIGGCAIGLGILVGKIVGH